MSGQPEQRVGPPFGRGKAESSEEGWETVVRYPTRMPPPLGFVSVLAGVSDCSLLVLLKPGQKREWVVVHPAG